jgi:hypothetical protein
LKALCESGIINREQELQNRINETEDFIFNGSRLTINVQKSAIGKTKGKEAVKPDEIEYIPVKICV